MGSADPYRATMASLSADQTAAISSFVYDWAADEGVPGTSVAIVVDDELAFTAGIGSRDLASNAPATPETLYGIGSVTKSFTALAIVQLADRGSLELADPITEYVPVAGLEDVSLHQLLTHSSGLPSLAVSEALIARRAGLGEAGVPLGDREDFYHYLEGAVDEWTETPAGRFMYANSGFMLLADVVEAVDGRPFATYVEEEILAPLGMERSTFDAAAFAADSDAMTPYECGDDGPEARPLPVRELSHGPGGLLASVTELANYLRLQLSDGTFEGTRLVSADGLERMHGAHVETAEGPYGYGWRTREVAGEPLVGHSGSIGVSTAYVGFAPNAGVGVALAANAAPGYALAHVGEALVAILLDEAPTEVVGFVRRRERFDVLTGSYETYRGVRSATIEAVGGILQLTFEDAFAGEPIPLIPRAESADGYEWYTPAAGGERKPVQFVVDGDDVDCYVDRWRLHKRS